MDIELEGGSAIAVIIVILLILLLIFGLVGKFVTPVDAASEPQWLSPAQWTAYRLQKEARKETEMMIRDARRIQAILEKDAPDPVEAMLVAQDIYATYQSGSSATAAARNALIAAAEATVRATVGEIPRDQAIAAYEQAIERINALSTSVSPEPDHAPTPTPTLSAVYTPLQLHP